MRLAIGCDHGGYRLKEELKETLQNVGVEFEDLGIFDETSCDYPVIAKKLCQAITNGEFSRGILICGTGIGVSIVANRHKGIRAALCNDVFSAVMSREHNDANVLCLGARVIGFGTADMIVRQWLKTDFANGRHQRRLDMID